ncbi:UNVERIFIED_CONTAM: hypothetical protein HDU68_008628 [Siphonaria sp. JEL0065]|nr:hypothetical protein HDU68_008628 [Siphonaria sp. JEL0065]
MSHTTYTPVPGDLLEDGISDSELNDVDPTTITIPSQQDKIKLASLLSFDENTQGRLIKLIGIPPADGETTNSKDEDSPCLKDVRDIELPIRPPVITMGLDEKGRPIVDMIDSMDEDPFTLDSFEKMIRTHAAHGKDFLIARVATVDPQDETRFYYSYYSAHQINKVLFRTQPEEGLLHRMKAKNPLNNMVIMGDVHYYVIKAMAVNVALLTNRNAPTISVASTLATATTAVEPKEYPRLVGVLARRLSTKVNRFLHQMNNTDESLEFSSDVNVSAMESGGALHKQQESAKTNDTVLAYMDQFNAFLKSFKEETIPASASSSIIDYCREFEILRDHYLHEVQGIVFPQGGNNRNVKNSCFVNEYTQSRGSVLSFEDWLSQVAAPQPKHGRKGLEQQQQHQQHATMIKIHSFVGNVNGNDDAGASAKLFYVAEYLASDDDFLMKSSIRAIFRENALESDDAVLFTLPNSNSGGGSTRRDPVLRNLLEAMEDNGWSVTSKSFKLFMLSYFMLSVIIVKFLGKLFKLWFGFGFDGNIELLQTVPEEYFYVASFSMVFLLCLFLIIAL